MGVTLGHALMRADQDNEKGYWEDMDFFSINEEMLAALDRAWHQLRPFTAQDMATLKARGFHERAIQLVERKMEEGNPLGVKDPRFALLLPFWQTVFTALELESAYVITLRHPYPGACSLAHRNQFPHDTSCWLWLVYTLEALIHTQGHTRVIVDYDALLEAPEIQLQRMARVLGLTLDPAKRADYCRAFLDPALRHNPPLTPPPDTLPPLALEVYRTLQALAVERPEALASFTLPEKWRDAYADAKSLFQIVDRYDRKASALAHDADALTNHVRTVEEANRVQAGQIEALTQAWRDGETKNAQLTAIITTQATRLADAHPAYSNDPALATTRAGRLLRRARRLRISITLFRLHRRSGVLDRAWYRERNPEAAAGMMGPLLHFVLRGVFEGRAPHPGFDATSYLTLNPDVAASGIPPLIHYMLQGYKEHRRTIDPASKQ